jgi:ATPase family associated with various cellular activities (AAA)
MASQADLPGEPAIVADNIRAVQAAWFASQLERMRFFDVADRIVERFQAGLLPLGRGAAGRRVLGSVPLEGGLSATARRQLWARTPGLLGGDAAATAQRDFQDLWLRFIASVSNFARQPDVSDLLRTTSRRAVWQSARALATQLSAWGSGGPFFAAKELARDVNRLRDLLQDATVLSAFGARDMWSVIDQVAGSELGGAVNVVRYRERAVAGSTVLQWLADHADALQRHPEPPADADLPGAALHNAVARWLALADTHADAKDKTKPDARTNADVAPGKAPAVSPWAGAATRATATAKLGQVASRYLGETEKNLGALFERAKDSNAVLLFDEADALFGRRTEVKDAHDRHAGSEDAPPPPPPPPPAPAPAPAPAVGVPVAGDPLRRQLPSTRRISRP